MIEDARQQKNKLRRTLGPGDLVLFYTVAVVGLRWIANASTIGPSAISLWLIAFACFFVPLALTVNELSSRYPEEGGIYSWAKQAFGYFHGFMAGWTYWTCNIFVFPAVLLFGASNAAYAIPRFSHLAASKAFLVACSLLAIVIALTMNILGLDIGKWLHNAGGLIGTWLPAAILIAMGFIAWLKFGSATDFSISSMKPRVGGVKDLLLLSSIAFAFSGLEAASVMSEEVRDPKRSIPRALLASGAIITLIYIVGTVSVLLALPADQTSGLVGINNAIRATGEHLGGAGVGRGLGSLLGILLFVAVIGNLGAWMAAIARLPFVAGIDGFLPEMFTRVHPKWRTPYVALLVQGVGIGFLLLLSLAGQKAEQAYQLLVNLGVIIYFIPYLYMFASLIALQREPVAEDVIRVPGKSVGAYVLGGTGFLVTFVSIVLSCIPGAGVVDRVAFFATVFGCVGTTLLVGALIYLIGARRERFKV